MGVGDVPSLMQDMVGVNCGCGSDAMDDPEDGSIVDLSADDARERCSNCGGKLTWSTFYAGVRLRTCPHCE